MLVRHREPIFKYRNDIGNRLITDIIHRYQMLDRCRANMNIGFRCRSDLGPYPNGTLFDIVSASLSDIVYRQIAMLVRYRSPIFIWYQKPMLKLFIGIWCLTDIGLIPIYVSDAGPISDQYQVVPFLTLVLHLHPILPIDKSQYQSVFSNWFQLYCYKPESDQHWVRMSDKDWDMSVHNIE